MIQTRRQFPNLIPNVPQLDPGETVFYFANRTITQRINKTCQ